MALPISNTYQRDPDHPSIGVRTSPSESSNSSPQAMIPPPTNPFAMAPAGRTPGLSAPLPHIGSRSPGYNATPYSHLYGTSASPSTASGSLQESQSNDPASLSTAGISPTQISSSNLNAQKRAYRQRRKDPSCDACRERKVKCDATETSACSECSSRNHKCQFTKETNRRMSSIKQVQDLQSQLADLRQENSHLRSRMSDRDAMDIDRRQPDSQREIQMTVQKARPPTMNNFDLVRRNIRTHSRDIFEPPPPYRQTSVLMSSPSALPEIPSRADFARLSRSYLDSVHESFPVVHWPTFQREVDQVYTARSFQGMPQGWIGLFFAVMACGALQPSTSHESPKSSKASMSYSEISSQSLTPWPEEPSLTHAKVAILLSIFNHESNMKSAGSMWLASAVGIAQELGLHAETETWPVVEGETRRRLWWSIYTWDRILSLAVGRPMLINNEDCHVSLPSSLEDRYIQPQGFTRTPSTQTPFTGFAAIIHLVREFSHLHQALRSSIIGSQTLQSLDETFRAKLTTFPESYRLESNASLEPASLSPILILQFARFHLCRHNLSPVCRPPERADALHRCTLVAQETAKYISRTLPMPESEKNWQARVAQIASNMICTHIWRCMLVLCFRADYKGALMCLRLSAAIGDARKVNIACGKNLAFFLDLLLERVRSGDGGQHKLEHDEEMLAYVSGDMQGNLEHSWVWAGGDFASSQTPVHTSPRSGIQTHGNDEPMQGTHLPLRPNTGSPGNGTREWDGWSRIEGMIHQLIEEHRARLAQPSSYYPPPHNPVKRVQLAPDAPVSPPMAAPTSNVVPVGTNRISIANII